MDNMAKDAEGGDISMRASRCTNRFRTTGLRLGKFSRGCCQLLGVAALLLTAAIGNALGASPDEVPVINGNLGPCTVDFTILDSSDKPIYDAKIRVTILYGFMNKRKSDLEIGTNGDGKARFEGLPDKVKKPPLEFKVSSGDLAKTVKHDPASDCHPKFTIALGKP
jgi:hypothetical protein